MSGSDWATARSSPQRTPRTQRPEKRILFVILVLIRPVLALEWPILLVVANQAFDVELAEHLGREATPREIGDLDLELLFLADDGVDLAHPGLAQKVSQPPVELTQRFVRQRGRGVVKSPAKLRR